MRTGKGRLLQAALLSLLLASCALPSAEEAGNAVLTLKGGDFVLEGEAEHTERGRDG